MEKKPDDEFKTLDFIVRYYAIDGVSQEKIIKAILHETIPITVVGKPPNISETVYISVISLRKLMIESHYISIPETSKLLEVKQEVAYHLVNIGLLDSIDKGRAGRFVKKKSIDEFRAKYVWARDLAREQETSSRKVKTELKSVMVEPISGPSVDGGRQLLYARDAATRAFLQISGLGPST